MTTTGFEVQPGHLRSAAGDMRVIGSTVSSVYAYASDHLSVPHGGITYNLFAAEVENIRDDLLAGYEAGGPAESLFYEAANGLGALAYDYEQVDLAQARTYDDLLTDAGEAPPMRSFEWGNDEVGLEKAGLLDIVGSAPDDAFAEYDAFEKINDKIDDALKLKWVTSALGRVGIDFDPAGLIEEHFGGDWEAMGTSLSALKQVQRYWTEVSQQLQGVVGRFDASWSGTAANATKTWFADLQDATFDHGTAIGKNLSRIKAESLAFIEQVDLLVSAVEDIADLIPQFDLSGGFLDVAKSVAKELLDTALGPVKVAIDRFWTFWDAARTGAHTLAAVFAQLTRFFDTEWPRVPGYEAPDVDGPDL